MTDLLYHDTEEALRDSVRALLGRQLTTQDILGRYDDPASASDDLWTTLARELGVAALLVPQRHGGHGTAAREAAVVLEELGRAVAPVPFLTSAVIATCCLAATDDDELLPVLATGEATAALAVPLTPGSVPPEPSLTSGEGRLLSGEVTSVADAATATVLIVPARGARGLELHAVDAGAAGLTLTPVSSLDMTRPLVDLRLTEVPSRPIASGAQARTALEAGLRAGAALLASEQVGLAEWCLRTTVAYLTERRQFGRPLGSFQALKHRLADVLLELTTARAVARHAADCVATGSDDTAVAAALAQAHCAPVAVHAAEECVQLHGGIGMTWEHPAHLYLKRAKSDELALGTPVMHRARLAELVDIPC